MHSSSKSRDYPLFICLFLLPLLLLLLLFLLPHHPVSFHMWWKERIRIYWGFSFRSIFLSGQSSTSSASCLWFVHLILYTTTTTTMKKKQSVALCSDPSNYSPPPNPSLINTPYVKHIYEYTLQVQTVRKTDSTPTHISIFSCNSNEIAVRYPVQNSLWLNH